MTLNIAALRSQLAAKIAAIDTSTDANELLLLSASVNNVTTDNIVAVNTTADLPDLQTGLTTFPFPSGSIFYVRSLQVLVISSKARWIGFDGRILRSDAPIVVAYAWGEGFLGRLGDDTATAKSSPVTVIGGITNWNQLSAGNAHSLGVTSTGIAYGWGYNGKGGLGDGTTTSRRSPVTVVGGITNWSQVDAAWGTHSLGVTSAGIAYAWGYNSYGQLGTGNTTSSRSPVTVIGGITNWSQLSAGGEHSLGVTSAGIAYAWGRNNTFGGLAGRLGDGTTTNRSSPVTVVGGITNWSQVSAGLQHSLGLTSTGIAYAWGINLYGNLGDGTQTSRSSPVTVVGGITNWSQVSAGNQHSLGLTSAGIAYAWGLNTSGRLGDGTTGNKSSPVTVVGGITNWSQLNGGLTHSLGLTSTGIAYAWGSSNTGQLGDGTTTSRSSPVTVVGGITNWAQLSAGEHSLALTAT
jgi:alpha-tubulin suppressor-like RCC1 family protein